MCKRKKKVAMLFMDASANSRNPEKSRRDESNTTLSTPELSRQPAVMVALALKLLNSCKSRKAILWLDGQPVSR